MHLQKETNQLLNGVFGIVFLGMSILKKKNSLRDFISSFTYENLRFRLFSRFEWNLIKKLNMIFTIHNFCITYLVLLIIVLQSEFCNGM